MIQEGVSISHPGFIDHSDPDFDWEKARNERNFEQFAQFINCDGLSDLEREEILRLLRELFDVTKNFWEVDQCRNANLIETEIIKILKNPKFNVIKVARLRRFKRLHYWTELLLTDNKYFVVDPVGGPVEKTGFRDKKCYKPFFGLREKAPWFLQEAYTNGEDTDDWGTRSLPPRFSM